MSHWAQLDENNYVINVTVGDNDDPNGDEGYKWLIDNIGGRWIKTSYTSRRGVRYNPENGEDVVDSVAFKLNFASVGSYYDEVADSFYQPQPFKGWVLNKEDGWWYPPTPNPSTEEQGYNWDEESESWIMVPLA
jgi:hypothetical protein